MLTVTRGANLTRNPLIALYKERLDLWTKVDRLTADGEYARANSLTDYIEHYLEPLIQQKVGL